MQSRMSRSILVLLTFPAVLALAGCDGETPVATVVPDGDAEEHPITEKADYAVANIRDEGLQQPVEPAMNIHKFNNPRGGSMTRRTWKSAYRVDRAAREFARDNDGWFATGIHDRNVAGKTLIDYLPGGHLLKNAFTELRTEPCDCSASYSGSVGYLTIFNNGYPVGYTIDAMGVDSGEVLHIEYKPD